jgi:hypothetical protein
LGVQLLGIRPLDSFDHMKMAYKKKRKDAEETADDEFLAKVWEECSYIRVLCSHMAIASPRY